MITPDFFGATCLAEPFPHIRIPQILLPTEATPALQWLREEAPWRLKIADFYEQEECSLLAAVLTHEVKALVEPAFILRIVDFLRNAFSIAGELTVTDVAAHRLRQGQTIRVHNDYISGRETHRLLIQLNAGWRPEQGGLLMFFGSPAAEDVTDVIVPVSGSGLAFEISPRSFHAVSQIKDGERYTLVYSFRVEA